MNDVLNEVLQLEKSTHSDRNITWMIDDLPEVTGDYSLIRQVWHNLISNAVKFTRHREEAIIEIGYKENELSNEFFINFLCRTPGGVTEALFGKLRPTPPVTPADREMRCECELRGASCELRDARCELRVARCELHISNRKLRLHLRRKIFAKPARID